MKYSICFIDDKIPVENFPNYFDDTKIINESTLKYLIDNIKVWDETAVHNLVLELLAQNDKWHVNSFKNPSFFINHQKDELYSPEIILYDWDYGFGPNSNEAEEYLLKILNNTYAIIHIFTHADENNEISDILSKPAFKTFKERLNLIKKGEEGSIQKVLESAENRYKENFSYKFGKELFLNAHKALNKILVSISQLSFEQFVSSIGNKLPDGRNVITRNNMIEIISEKFKHELHEHNFSEIETPFQLTHSSDIELVRKIWAYRLYYKPNDDIVRKGDIIKRISDGNLFIVISSDCHLNAFWNKNYGYISLIPLHKLENNNNFNNKFCALKSSKISNFTLTSLTNPNIQDITILPSIQIEESDEMNDYLLVPKEICSIYIELPNLTNINDIKNNLQLKYSFWSEIDSKNRLSISEPFKSPLIQFILENITGYGCPDFPYSLQQHLKSKFNDAFS